jgi:hypothetical protein
MIHNAFFSLLLRLAAMLFFICCTDSEKSEGAEGGACYPNGTCNEGLECHSSLCVDITMDSSNDSQGGTDFSIDFNDCFACGEDACSTEANACADNGGCDDVLKCYLNCNTDTTCIQQCDISALTVDTVSAIQNYWTCISSNCIERCTPEFPTDDGSTDITDEETCTGSGTTGYCSDETAVSCVDGYLVQSDCSFCDIVSSEYCGQMTAFVLDSSYNAVDGDLVSFVKKSISVTATFDFSSSLNTGYIQLRFASPKILNNVAVTSTTAVSKLDATIENSDSSNGCEYTIASTGSLLSSSTDYCWGDPGYDPLDGSESSLVNVRLQAGSTGTQSLTITQFDLY